MLATRPSFPPSSLSHATLVPLSPGFSRPCPRRTRSSLRPSNVFARTFLPRTTTGPIGPSPRPSPPQNQSCPILAPLFPTFSLSAPPPPCSRPLSPRSLWSTLTGCHGSPRSLSSSRDSLRYDPLLPFNSLSSHSLSAPQVQFCQERGDLG